MSIEAVGFEDVVIDASTSGATELRAAVDGLPIVVMAYTLVCEEDVGVGFSDGDELVPSLPFAANGGATPPYNPRGHFRTRPGQPLSIVLDDDVVVRGHMTIHVGPLRT